MLKKTAVKTTLNTDRHISKFQSKHMPMRTEFKEFLSLCLLDERQYRKLGVIQRATIAQLFKTYTNEETTDSEEDTNAPFCSRHPHRRTKRRTGYNKLCNGCLLISSKSKAKRKRKTTEQNANTTQMQ